MSYSQLADSFCEAGGPAFGPVLCLLGRYVLVGRLWAVSSSFLFRVGAFFSVLSFSASTLMAGDVLFLFRCLGASGGGAGVGGGCLGIVLSGLLASTLPIGAIKVAFCQRYLSVES